jgi:hypothetical protein
MGLKLGRLDAVAIVARFYLASRGMYISFLNYLAGISDEFFPLDAPEIVFLFRMVFR